MKTSHLRKLPNAFEQKRRTVSVSAVKTLLFRIRRKLRAKAARLGPKEEAPPDAPKISRNLAPVGHELARDLVKNKTNANHTSK